MPNMNAIYEESRLSSPVTSNITSNNEKKLKNPDVKFYLRKRYFVCFWACFGSTLLLLFVSNLSIALVELTTDKNVTTENGTILIKAELELDSQTIGFILSSFSYGFVLAPVGGILAVKFGGVRIFGLGVLVAALLTILTTFLLRFGIPFLVLVRFLIGFCESSTTTSFINIFTRWAPPHERSRLVAVAFAGLYVGTLFSYMLGGFLAKNYGVDSIFFITGGIGIIWYFVWLLFVSDGPSSDRFITQKERRYFENFQYQLTGAQQTKLKDYPWRLILTSKPAWAIFNEYFCFAWLTSFIFTGLPMYINDTFHVDIASVGFIAGIPVLGNLAGLVFFSFIFDFLRVKGIWRIGNIYKSFAAIGQLSSAIFLLLISYWADYFQSLVLLTIMRFLAGSAELTYHVALIDMFSEYAGIIRGIASSFYTFGALLSPTVMGFIVTDHSPESWNLYFAFLSVFNIFGLVIFFIFGSGELQEWATPKVTDDSKRTTTRP